MRNYTHTRGGLSKIEFDTESGDFVTTLSPEMPLPEPADAATADIIQMPDSHKTGSATPVDLDRKVG